MSKTKEQKGTIVHARLRTGKTTIRGELLVANMSLGQTKKETVLHGVKEMHQLQWHCPLSSAATHPLVSGRGTVCPSKVPQTPLSCHRGGGGGETLQ